MKGRFLIACVLLTAHATSPAPGQSNGAESRDPLISASGAAQVLVPPTGAMVVVLFEGRHSPDGPVVDSLYGLVQRAIGSRNASATVFGLGGGERRRGRDDTRAWFSQYGITRGIVIPSLSIDSVAGAIGRLRSVGVNSALAVTFTVDEADPAIHDAIRRATETARQHADAMAGAAGGTLGRLVRLSNQRINAGDLRRYAAGVTLESYTPPEHIGVRVTVHGTWTLQPN